MEIILKAGTGNARASFEKSGRQLTYAKQFPAVYRDTYAPITKPLARQVRNESNKKPPEKGQMLLRACAGAGLETAVEGQSGSELGRRAETRCSQGEEEFGKH